MALGVISLAADRSSVGVSCDNRITQVETEEEKATKERSRREMCAKKKSWCTPESHGATILLYLTTDALKYNTETRLNYTHNPKSSKKKKKT